MSTQSSIAPSTVAPSTVAPTPSPRCDIDSRNYGINGTAFASTSLPTNDPINAFSGDKLQLNPTPAPACNTNSLEICLLITWLASYLAGWIGLGLSYCYGVARIFFPLIKLDNIVPFVKQWDNPLGFCHFNCTCANDGKFSSSCAPNSCAWSRPPNQELKDLQPSTLLWIEF